MRIGWVIASMIPAIALASVARAAKPTTRPSTAVEARIPVASRRAASNWASASAIPITMMPAKISRRTSRRRVVATADSSPPATAALSLRAAAHQRAVHELRRHEREHHGDHRVDLLAVVLQEGGRVRWTYEMRLLPCMRLPARTPSLRAAMRVFVTTRVAVFLWPCSPPSPSAL